MNQLDNQGEALDVNTQAPQTPLLPSKTDLPEGEALLQEKRQQQRTIIIVILVALVLMLITIGSFVLLMRANPTSVSQIRDIFIIYLALQSLLIGLALVILLIQLARLINLLENEITPLLESTNETISNLRGTASFLSENMVQPVIKLNETLAGFMKLLALLGIATSRKKK